MNFSTVLTASFIAVAFVSWPIVGKYSGAQGSWVGTIVMVGTATVVAVFSAKQIAATPLPPAKALAFLLLAAVLNGVGVYLYAMKAADPSLPTGAFIVLVSVIMVAASSLLDWVFNGTIPRLRDIGGYGTAVLTIYLLGRF